MPSWRDGSRRDFRNVLPAVPFLLRRIGARHCVATGLGRPRVPARERVAG